MDFTNEELSQIVMGLIDRRSKLKNFIADDPADEGQFVLQLPAIESALAKLGIR
jgi:hypothetical protein